MRLAKVIGNLVSTIKETSYQRLKLLIVQPVGPDAQPSDPSLVVADLCQAGIGDYVLILQEGHSIRSMTGQDPSAVDTAAVGVIDYVEFEGKQQRLDDLAAAAGK